MHSGNVSEQPLNNQKMKNEKVKMKNGGHRKKALRHFSFLLFHFSFLSVFVFNSYAQINREQLYRLNNVGAAYMEQFKHEEAIKQFRQVLASDPNFILARINLALALFYLNDSKSALEEARSAIKLAPDNLHARYVFAMALRSEKLYDEALIEFNKVLASDPNDSACNIQIGQLYSQKQQYALAIPAFKKALDSESYNATAAYSLAQALIRSGKTAEGQQMLGKFQQLRASGYATTLGNVYGEKGRYGEAVLSTGIEPELVNKQVPNVQFNMATSPAMPDFNVKMPPLSSSVSIKLKKSEYNDKIKMDLVKPFATSLTVADLNNDISPEFIISAIDERGVPFLKIVQNDGNGKYIDITDKLKIKSSDYVVGAVCGDYDNDGKTDIALFGYQTLKLWHNNGDAGFEDITQKSGLPASYTYWGMTAAWVDYDHDNDIDLFIGNFADISKWPSNTDTAVFPDDFPGSPNKLFRNNGNGTFTDVTESTGLGGGNNKTTAVVCTDFDNHRDIDFVIANYKAPVQLFSNQRNGTFKDVAQSTGFNFNGATFSVAAGDLNKDGYIDFYFTDIVASSALLLSDGKGSFSQTMSGKPAAYAQIADIDNDGLLDIIGSDYILRNIGEFKTMQPILDNRILLNNNRAFASVDLNKDGSLDLVTFSNGSLLVLYNEGAGKNYVALNLDGKSSNRSAIGTKAEIRSGSLRQKLEVYSSSPSPAATGLSFGLGFRNTVDTVQLLWPGGVLQSELDVKALAVNTFEELDRKGTSCPILYAWNGTQFDFVTDFLGGSAIGYLTSPGKYNYPDTDEYIRITSDQLKENNGLLSLRMNNQLEEVIYFDAAKLTVIDHPVDVEIYPDEKLLPAPPYLPLKLFSVKSARPPLAAVDENGNDILSLITKIDRQYPENFEQLNFKGYTNEHAIILDLGDLKGADRPLLLMKAWIDYADSTSNLAASQAGAKLIPPYLQVKNKNGEWETVIEQMGFPAGLPKTMTVDLTGKFLSDDYKVRIVTSMRIYWDQILVETSGEQSPVQMRTLKPVTATLEWRGFPKEYSPDGRMPKIYDYNVIEPTAPWKTHKGNYTAYGDVLELLTSPDDMYVITRNGDEIHLDFDARKLPPLRNGWTRTYLLYANGFGKDMDINSARPDSVGELPYHKMKSYPYSKDDKYPTDKLKYIEKHNTRTY